MHEAGMYLGCHGHAHAWLDRLAPEELEDELMRALAFFENAGLRLERWVMCYPYGGYVAELAPAMRRHGAVAGLLAEPGIAAVASDDPFALPRLDTNDLPQEPVADAVAWTRTILEGV